MCPNRVRIVSRVETKKVLVSLADQFWVNGAELAVRAGIALQHLPVGNGLPAALAQTLRNAAQRHLTAELGTLGATLVRFLYGLPFAVAWLVVLDAQSGVARPAIPLSFPAWVMLGASTQIIATALLLRTMADRSFALGVAYSKTEVVQVAIIGFILLGDPVSLPVAAAAPALEHVKRRVEGLRRQCPPRRPARSAAKP